MKIVIKYQYYAELKSIILLYNSNQSTYYITVFQKNDYWLIFVKESHIKNLVTSKFLI